MIPARGLILAVTSVAVLAGWAGAAGDIPDSRPKNAGISDADRAFWSFQPVRREFDATSIDEFIRTALAQRGLAPAVEADRVTLIRRATFDLHGLPPTPAEVDAFLSDRSSDAYEKLIDRLLASPRYGERWARHWLDLVRYAESDGFKQDTYRPNAWPYRDYVIRSFNDDKRYDRFVQEQLAGDEIAPGDPSVVVATGFLRHGPYEYNQRDVPKQWADILNDVTDVTGDVFLGLSFSCARCHDHKFDPILQADYYRLQAFFTPMLPRDDYAEPAARVAEVAARQSAWEAKTAAVRAELATLEAPFVRKQSETALAKFPQSMQAVLAAPPAGRTPLEQQWAWLAYKQVYDREENPPVRITDKALKQTHEELKQKLAAFDGERPTPVQRCQIVGDVGPVAPPTVIPGKSGVPPVEPGRPTVLDRSAPALPMVAPTATSTGRRTALAKWITDPANPLTARVIVNRVWQSHFGRGLVATASDFGTLGDRPSHPALLDWLASQFVDADGCNWRFKSLHRLIMTSAAYRQSSLASAHDARRTADPDNRFLWRMTPRRLDSEQVRDAMLAVSGELLPDAGGPPVDAAVPRRSIYTKTMRNTRDRLLDAFDAPESFCSVASRNSTTTPSQALLLLNGDWPLKRAAAFAARVQRESTGAPDAAALVDTAYRIAYGRAPSDAEWNAATVVVSRDGGLVDFCHVLLSSNEFLYVD